MVGKETGLPIPLGCIAARTSLGQPAIKETEEAIASSLGWAYAHPEACTAYIKQHAQELDDQVISDHIKLYVNDFSRDLADIGRAAVQELLRRGKKSGIFNDKTGTSPLGVGSSV